VPFARGTAIERSVKPRERANKTLPQRFKACGMMNRGVVRWRSTESRKLKPGKREKRD